MAAAHVSATALGIAEGLLTVCVRAGASRHVVASTASALLRAVLGVVQIDSDEAAVREEASLRLRMVRPALEQQLRQSRVGCARLPGVRCGADRRRRNKALHAAVLSDAQSEHAAGRDMECGAAAESVRCAGGCERFYIGEQSPLSVRAEPRPDAAPRLRDAGGGATVAVCGEASAFPAVGELELVGDRGHPKLEEVTDTGPVEGWSPAEVSGKELAAPKVDVWGPAPLWPPFPRGITPQQARQEQRQPQLEQQHRGTSVEAPRPRQRVARQPQLHEQQRDSSVEAPRPQGEQQPQGRQQRAARQQQRRLSGPQERQQRARSGSSADGLQGPPRKLQGQQQEPQLHQTLQQREGLRQHEEEGRLQQEELQQQHELRQQQRQRQQPREWQGQEKEMRQGPQERLHEQRQEPQQRAERGGSGASERLQQQLQPCGRQQQQVPSPRQPQWAVRQQVAERQQEGFPVAHSHVVRVAVRPKKGKDWPKLVEGLKKFARLRPSVDYTVEGSGKHVLSCCGRMHLEICLEDLREKFARCDFSVSGCDGEAT